jgi:uncharacterized membrane protein (UPF0127 family)
VAAKLVAEDGRQLAWVGVCDTSRSRRRGLLGITQMATDECILLMPCRSIHTMGMKMPIDVAFLDRDQRVVAVREDMAPGKFLLSRRLFRTRAVLEAAAGAFRAWGLGIGDRLRLEAEE